MHGNLRRPGDPERESLNPTRDDQTRNNRKVWSLTIMRIHRQEERMVDVTSHIKLIRYSYNRLMFCNKG